MNKNRLYLIVIVLFGVVMNVYTWNFRYTSAYDQAFTFSFEESNQTAFTAFFEESYPHGFEDGHDIGYPVGFEDGHDSGYSDGFEDGRMRGFNEGFDQGSEEGYEAGFVEGEVEGEPMGFNAGYVDGNQTGFSVGYLAGVRDGGKNSIIRDPTFNETLVFLETDNSDLLGQDENSTSYYMVARIKQNAYDGGYRCFWVYLHVEGGWVNLIGFNTTDRGMIIVYPSSDALVTLEVGKQFYDWGNFLLTFDDTIIDWEFIQ